MSEFSHPQDMTEPREIARSETTGRTSAWLARQLISAELPESDYVRFEQEPRPSFYKMMTEPKVEKGGITDEAVTTFQGMVGRSEVDGQRTATWRSSSDGSWLYAHVNGGRPKIEDKANQVRIYCNIKPTFVLAMMEHLPLFLRDQGVRADLKTSLLGDWEKEDTIVLYANPTAVRDCLKVLDHFFRSWPDAFQQTTTLDLAAPVHYQSRSLTGIRLSQNPTSGPKGESRSFNDVRAKMLDQATREAEQVRAIGLTKQPGGWRLQVKVPEQWNQILRKHCVAADIDPEKLYLNLGSGSLVEGAIQEFV